MTNHCWSRAHREGILRRPSMSKWSSSFAPEKRGIGADIMKIFIKRPSLLAFAFGATLLVACGGKKAQVGPQDAAAEMPPLDIDDDLPAALVPGPAPTPPMGWNSWNAFKGNISDRLFRQIADAMVASGMQAAGYRYINID